MREGLYCKVIESVVVSGPKGLPPSDVPWSDNTNLHNESLWPDAKLISRINWYPATIISPTYDPITQYLGDYQLTIHAASVDAEQEVLDKSQEQIDKEVLASTEADPSNIDSDIRQFIDLPNQNKDRLVIKRISQTWNTADDIFALSATLYTKADASGMSIKIHNDGGTYLYTMALAEMAPGSGVWYAETHSSAWGQHLSRKAWKFYIFKGINLTQLMQLTLAAEQSAYDVKWNS